MIPRAAVDRSFFHLGVMIREDILRHFSFTHMVSLLPPPGFE